MKKPAELQEHWNPQLKREFHLLERKFRYGLAMAFFIPLLALSIYFHIQFETSLKEAGKLNLAAIAESQRNTIDLFLQERLVNLFSLIHSKAFTLSPTKLQMQEFLLDLRRNNDAFIDVGFLDEEGVQIGYAGPYPYLQNRNYSSQVWFQALMQPERNYYISDIYPGFRNKLHFTIATKLRIDDTPYVLRSTLDPDKFYLFLRTINHAQGVESFIVNAAGRFQSADPSRWQALSESPFHPPADPQANIQEIRDNKGSALVAYAWLKETRWALVVSEPPRLAYAQFYRARHIMLISSALISVMFILAIWSTMRTLIGKTREHAEMREQLHHQLLHASKLASLGELATGVAHEINNPLAIIMATSGVIKDRLNPEFAIDNSTDTILEELKTIDVAVLRAKRITQQLLNYGRKSEPNFEKANLNKILEEVLEGVKSREFALADIHLNRNLDPHLPDIMVDPDQIRQVLVNLLNNASDAMAGPGHIEVASGAQNGSVKLTITDTGCGMDADRIGKIFDPFYTSKEVGKGTGLGLSVSLGIIESMGGSLTVQSLPGKGSAFTIRLPVEQPDRSRA
jgi:two-component system, NtrC family, sensor kinase